MRKQIGEMEGSGDGGGGGKEKATLFISRSGSTILANSSPLANYDSRNRRG